MDACPITVVDYIQNVAEVVAGKWKEKSWTHKTGFALCEMLCLWIQLENLTDFSFLIFKKRVKSNYVNRGGGLN